MLQFEEYIMTRGLRFTLWSCRIAADPLANDPEAKKVKDWRHRLQRGFLGKNMPATEVSLAISRAQTGDTTSRRR